VARLYVRWFLDENVAAHAHEELQTGKMTVHAALFKACAVCKAVEPADAEAFLAYFTRTAVRLYA
jgi:hypothetical protein